MIQRKLFRIANRTTLWRKSFKLIAQVKSWAFKFWHFQTNQHKKTFRSSLLLVLCTTSTNQNENSKFPYIIHVEKTALDFGRNDSRREKKTLPMTTTCYSFAPSNTENGSLFAQTDVELREHIGDWRNAFRPNSLTKKYSHWIYTVFPFSVDSMCINFMGVFFLFIHSVYRIDIAHT